MASAVFPVVHVVHTAALVVVLFTGLHCVSIVWGNAFTNALTILKVLYDKDYLYFAFLCEDPEPEKIQLGASRRDGISSRSGTDSVSTR